MKIYGGCSVPELESLDPLALFAELNAAGVEWVLVGGLAVALHGGSSVTDDLDLTLAVNPANVIAVNRFFQSVHARLPRGQGVFQANLADLMRPRISVHTKFGRVDLIHHFPDGLTAAELMASAETHTLGDVNVQVARVADLIRIKSATERANDLVHLRELQTILDETDSNPCDS